MGSAFHVLVEYLPIRIYDVIDMYLGIRTESGLFSTLKWTNLDGLYCRKNNKPTEILLSSGNVKKQWRNERGQYHRINKPAVISYGKNRLHEQWYERGQRHRIGAPAILIYHNGQIVEESWYEQGQRHRIGSPAYIAYYANSSKSEERWYQNNKLYRIDGPAVVGYHINGIPQSQTWFKNDKYFRCDHEPDHIVYNQNGEIVEETWRRKNVIKPPSVTYFPFFVQVRCYEDSIYTHRQIAKNDHQKIAYFRYLCGSINLFC